MEWATLLFGLATAVATGVTAYVVWHQWRGAIQVEWEPAWHDMYEKSIPPHLEVRITIRNYHNFGIQAQSASAMRCPVLNVTRDDKLRKHESWGPHQTPLDLDVEPGASKSCTVLVFPDWKSLAKRKSVTMRPNSSTALRIQVCIASKARKRMRIRAHTTIAIPNERIAKAATVAKA